MSQIRFEYDFEKFVQALAYFAWRDLPDLDKLKVAKLLYYADKKHLLAYGRPILGDTYYCLDHGPVPSASVNLLNEAEQQTTSQRHELDSKIHNYVDVDTSKTYPIFTKKREPDLDVFSDSEIAVLNDVIQEHGARSGWELRNLTHTEPTWRIPDRDRSQGRRVHIPYELFFEGNDAAKPILELVRDEQRDRDLAETLT